MHWRRTDDGFGTAEGVAHAAVERLDVVAAKRIVAVLEGFNAMTNVGEHLVKRRGEVVVVIGLEIKMASRAGTANLCIPYNVIEPLMEDLSAQSWFSVKGLKDSEEFAGRITDRIGRATVELSGLLAETTITLRDLMHLAVGDLLLTEAEADRPAILCIEGERKFHADLGRFKGSRALKVGRPVAAREG